MDIFGKCGKPFNTTVEVLLRPYKFYIAFENSLCKDYITEKFFERYNNDIILVARGGAEYSKILPTQSYINTADFTRIEDLAMYLLSVASDEAAYSNFLRQKDFLRSVSTVRWDYGLCALCEKMNNLELYRNYYKDPFSYLTHKQCFQPKDIN